MVRDAARPNLRPTRLTCDHASQPAKSAVPESVLKKRKRQEKWDEENRAKSAAAATAGTAKKAEAFKRAEQYVKEYREQEQQLVTMKRAARKAGTFYVEPEQKVLFVMRLRGINGIHPKTRHILKVLRLLQMHNGVFMKVNKATMNMLVKVDPYIMYGYPNLKTVSFASCRTWPQGHAPHSTGTAPPKTLGTAQSCGKRSAASCTPA